MKKGFAYVALSALALAAPASAERIYVPVLEKAAEDGGVVATRVRAGGQVLADLAPAKRSGLISFETEEAFEVSAWTVDRAGREIAEVPVFSDAEAYVAGLDVPLDRLTRPRAVASLQVGAANLSEQIAFCQATLFGRNGNRLAEIPFEVEPMSLTRKDGLAVAGRGRVSEVRITCDQSFYPFALTADARGLNRTLAKGTGPNGACDYFLPLVRQNDGSFSLQTPPGVFHTATKGDPKGIVCVKSGTELRVAKATFEWSVTAGPWSQRNRAGLHNLGYFFLERYRSGTVGNINVAGPNKNIIRFIQNVNMPAGTNTNTKTGYATQTGATYRYIYTFDAAKKSASLQVFHNGIEVKKLNADAKPGNNQTLILDPYGSGNLAGLAMVLEFGNFLGQHHPEEASIGWKYANLKVNVITK